ncbi:hypothetical protein ACJJJB_00195 (plasmid) [Microbulbifer sp. ANSA001]|uniref:hypothetical protein n=1 Tax=Microbulbifer sp. ANSA001 TaxID=3243358 RepID=UPI0040417889
MKPQSLATAIAFALALTACVSAGNPFDWATVRQVEVGMTAIELKELMGQPTRITATGDQELWTWSQVDTSWDLSSTSRVVTFVLRDGVVAEVPNLSESLQ